MDKSVLEVLADLEPHVEGLIHRHEEKRTLWFSSEILPASAHEFTEETAAASDMKRQRLRERARCIEDPAKVALTLNLITEEGLPHFHRIIATGLGNATFWSRWNNLWTAEEDRHGGILRDYIRDSAVLDFRALEGEQFSYIKAGFYPSWQADAYKLFVYTTLQEKATQISHLNTGKFAKEPTLLYILENIAQDESRHYAFYFTVSTHIIERDPNNFLVAALDILPSLDMPGLSAQHFNEYSDVVRRSGIYGPWHYKKAVEDILKGWKVAELQGLNAGGREAQDRLMAIPSKIERYAKILDQRKTEKSFSFPVIYGRVFKA